MATIFTWILVGVFGLFALAGIIAVIKLVANRMHREASGDIFLMNRDTKNGSPPIELRAIRDYRYKDANVDPYKDE